MDTCKKCNSTHIKRNEVYQYHNTLECLNCGHWIYEKLEDCCRNPFEITVIDRRSHDLSFLRRQCCNCGGCFDMKKPLSFKVYGDSIKGDFSLETFNTWKTERSKEAKTLYTYQLSSFRYKYLEYLFSDEWKAKRKLVLARENNLCQRCKNAPAEEIHHLHYDNLYNEPLEDLQALCKPCHLKVHRPLSCE